MHMKSRIWQESPCLPSIPPRCPVCIPTPSVRVTTLPITHHPLTSVASHLNALKLPIMPLCLVTMVISDLDSERGWAAVRPCLTYLTGADLRSMWWTLMTNLSGLHKWQFLWQANLSMIWNKVSGGQQVSPSDHQLVSREWPWRQGGHMTYYQTWKVAPSEKMINKSTVKVADIVQICVFLGTQAKSVDNQFNQSQLS